MASALQRRHRYRAAQPRTKARRSGTAMATKSAAPLGAQRASGSKRHGVRQRQLQKTRLHRRRPRPACNRGLGRLGVKTTGEGGPQQNGTAAAHGPAGSRLRNVAVHRRRGDSEVAGRRRQCGDEATAAMQGCGGLAQRYSQAMARVTPAT